MRGIRQLLTLWLPMWVALMAASGCRSLDPQHYPTEEQWHVEHPPAASWHSVRVTPPDDLPRPQWYKKINPVWWFKNSADPRPPDWYRPGKKTRTMTWYLRNPFHNFDNYVLGVADHDTIRSGKYPGQNMNPHGGWSVAVTAYKRLRLPFVSYEGHGIAFYLGWRERGDFGAKLNFKREKSENAKKASAP